MFRLSYKCRLCGHLTMGESFNIDREAAKNLINQTVAMEQHMNGLLGEKKMTAIHECSNGSIGIADFQGLNYLP